MVKNTIPALKQLRWHAIRVVKGMVFFMLIIFAACNSKPDVAFLDYVEDPTLAKARQGFYDALADNGFIKDSTIYIDYLNAQGDQPTLLQACQVLLAKKPKLIATNTTLATVVTAQQNNYIPIFMMVAPRPDIAKLTDKAGKAPQNLFGIYETLEYIDSSVSIIHTLMPQVKTLGLIYNQAEPQSVDAFNVVKQACEKNNIELKSLPVTNSGETQLTTEALINENIDAFFALPDNVIFASFETIVQSCDKHNIPVFTSEAGLVSRGAVASFGADFYQWGYQSGLQAAHYLKTNKTKGLKPEIVKVRSKVYNPAQARKFNITPGADFKPF